MVRFSLKLLSLFCSLGDNGLVDVLKTFDDLGADGGGGGGGGKLLLMFDSTHRLGSLTIGWTGNEIGRTAKNRDHCDRKLK